MVSFRLNSILSTSKYEPRSYWQRCAYRWIGVLWIWFVFLNWMNSCFCHLTWSNVTCFEHFVLTDTNRSNVCWFLYPPNRTCSVRVQFRYATEIECGVIFDPPHKVGTRKTSKKSGLGDKFDWMTTIRKRQDKKTFLIEHKWDYYCASCSSVAPLWNSNSPKWKSLYYPKSFIVHFVGPFMVNNQWWTGRTKPHWRRHTHTHPHTYTHARTHTHIESSRPTNTFGFVCMVDRRFC